MKIEDLKIISGPNYWSVNRQHLVLMRLDIEEMEDRPTNSIPGFYERIKALLPSLYEHRCSKHEAGGFFQRVREGTWIGHVIEHIALEIQTLAGMDTGFGRTRGTGKRGVYNIVFSYLEPRAGKYAAQAAINIAEALISGQAYDVQADIDELKEIWMDDRLGPSTSSIVEEARRRNIPVMRLDDNSLIQLGYGINQKRIEATIASTTGNIAVELAGDKNATKRLLKSSEIPIPAGGIVSDENELEDLINSIGYPIVIKPRYGNQGRGATSDIRNLDDALAALARAQNYSNHAVCERFIAGKDFRALVINYQFVAAAMRKPASVTGDGIHTIRELVDMVNADPRRGSGHENVMTRITIDEGTMQLLLNKEFTPDTILHDGEECLLKTTANLSTGGIASDVTDTVHPKNITLFNRIARVIGLDICGIDIIAENLSAPIEEIGGAVIEVNAAPGFRMHLQPSFGRPRNVAAPVLDMLFPPGKNFTIPLIAVTGTNGKTTTTRLISAMCRQQGFTCGYTTTEGIYINEDRIVKGDCSGPASARLVLQDPSVEMAVLECARGGILRNGLGFQQCDVAVVTNVAEDHLGLAGIDSLEKMARVKSVVPESVKTNGYAILNADDELVYEMRNNLSCNVALFSLDENSDRISEHCAKGGLAAVFTGCCINLLRGKDTVKIEVVRKIPVTFDGLAEFNVANVLAAVLAAYVINIRIGNIRNALRRFRPAADINPGRMNIFHCRHFKVLIDYAHNPHGMRALGKFIHSVPASHNWE